MTIQSTVSHVERLELTFADKPWDFARLRHDEIAAHFADHQRRTPALWNGRVLLMHDYAISDGVLRGAFLETDFASFSAWRDWGFPDSAVHDCFGAGAIRTPEGAFLLGVMGSNNAKPGEIYFPCGTPDPNDRVGGKIDFDRNVTREIAEETGLDASDFVAEPGWTVVNEGARIALIKMLHAKDSAGALRARVLAHLALEKQPELSGIRLVRSAAELEPAVLTFVSAFLMHHWG